MVFFLFCTFSPCYACSRLIINAGIRQIYHETYYLNPWAQNFLAEAKVACVPVTDGPEMKTYESRRLRPQEGALPKPFTRLDP